MFASRAIRRVAFIATSLALTSVSVGVPSALSEPGSWTSDTKIACVQQNWSTIKAKYDPEISQLSESDRQALGDLLGSDGKLIDNPSTDQLKSMANKLPSSTLDETLSGIC